MKISFLCFDVSNNSLVRPVLLAQSIFKHHEVEIIGLARQGGTWFPFKDSKLSIKSLPWRRYPLGFFTIRQMAMEINGDVVVACKTRPSSFGIGLIKKWTSKKPLILDIDEWELGFYNDSNFCGKIRKMIGFLDFSNPNGLPYTWFMERLVNLADGVTVSNRFLQARFSGILLYHSPDTSVLDPQKFDPQQAKENLGLKNTKVLMFVGTPRIHKGVEDLVEAFKRIHDPNLRLVIIRIDESTKFLLARCIAVTDRILFLPPVPISQVPQYLASADIVVIPQRSNSSTVGQIPAKIFEAMAMAKPIISTRVSDIPEVLGDCGYLVEPGNVEELVTSINYVFDHKEEAKLKGNMARERCIALYDTKILGKKLLNIVDQVIKKRDADN